MISREEALKKLLQTQAILSNLRLEFPDKVELRHAKILLDDLETEFFNGYSLEDVQPAEDVGVYAARVMEGGPYRDWLTGCVT